MKKNAFKVGDIVRPSTQEEARRIQHGWTGTVSFDTRFKVVVIVQKAITHRGPERPDSGIIVQRFIEGTTDGWENGYPYIWDADRFTKI